MEHREVDHLFRYTFQKTSAEVKEKAGAKATAIRAKIAEREERIARLREEHGIDDTALISLLTQARRAEKERERMQAYTYTSNSATPAGAKKTEEKTIGVGVVSDFLVESDFIEGEKADVKRLDLLVRNLKPVKTNAGGNGNPYEVDAFTLSYEELEFLGF